MKKEKEEIVRWTKKDKTIYWCDFCEMWHYKDSKIGRHHQKFVLKEKESDKNE